MCVCVPLECSPGFSLFLQGCVKVCPPGFSSGLQQLNLSLESWVEQSSVQACLPCHPSCLTCSGPGPSDCFSCPTHSHLLLGSCLNQSPIQRKSPSGPASPLVEEEGEVVEEGVGRGQVVPIPPKPPNHLPVLVGVLSCAFILATIAGVFLLLQSRSSSAPCGRRTKLPSLASAGEGLRAGLGLGGRDRGARVSYRGIPTVWVDEELADGSESENEEFDCQSERMAFIRTQSSL